MQTLPLGGHEIAAEHVMVHLVALSTAATTTGNLSGTRTPDQNKDISKAEETVLTNSTLDSSGCLYRAINLIPPRDSVIYVLALWLNYRQLCLLQGDQEHRQAQHVRHGEEVLLRFREWSVCLPRSYGSWFQTYL